MTLRACIDSVDNYALLGALDVASGLIDQCLSQQPPETAAPGSVASILCTPEMRGFREDPGFQSLVTRLGLMEYWKQYGPPDDCDLKDGTLSCH
jgi:hypothetical protein